MDPLWSETCWSTFKYFKILIVSTYCVLCISWIINYSSLMHGANMKYVVYIRGIPDKNLVPQIGENYWGFSWMFLVPLGVCWDQRCKKLGGQVTMAPKNITVKPNICRGWVRNMSQVTLLVLEFWNVTIILENLFTTVWGITQFKLSLIRT